MRIICCLQNNREREQSNKSTHGSNTVRREYLKKQSHDNNHYELFCCMSMLVAARASCIDNCMLYYSNHPGYVAFVQFNDL